MTNFTQSFLITSLNRKLSDSYIQNLLKENTIDPLDTSFQIYEKAMGIEDVRNIQKAALLKPFRGKTKAVIVDTYTDITTQAQNALLKILEEPPANTIIILMATKKEVFLPTIISRCKVITLQDKQAQLSDDDLSKLQETLSTLLNGKTGDKLKIAQDITINKENASLWLEKMAVFLENKLKENGRDAKLLNFFKELQSTYRDIKNTNVSQRTALENLFLSF